MSLLIDSPEAELQLESMRLDPEIFTALRSLMDEGIAVIKGANSLDLCCATIADYNAWCADNFAYFQQNLDVLGRPKRLVNFHLYSKNALALGLNEKIHRILDVMFNAKSSIYTSLTFKFGTQQPVHRDTPHFATWPELNFAGVWHALEDVDSDSGPLFYHPGAHKIKIPHPSEFMRQANQRIPNSTLEERLFMALDLYNGEVIRRSEEFCKPVILDVSKGDVIIWHPNMPHGGSNANNPMKSRWSIVFHCAPENIQVHQSDKFFQHMDNIPPLPRYGYLDNHYRKIALSGEISFM